MKLSWTDLIYKKKFKSRFLLEFRRNVWNPPYWVLFSWCRKNDLLGRAHGPLEPPPVWRRTWSPLDSIRNGFENGVFGFCRCWQEIFKTEIYCIASDRRTVRDVDTQTDKEELPFLHKARTLSERRQRERERELNEQTCSENRLGKSGHHWRHLPQFCVNCNDQHQGNGILFNRNIWWV